MVERVERRELSTGHVLVIAGALASAILVGREAAARLPESSEDLWTAARALAVEGVAQEIPAAKLLRIAESLRGVSLLSGSQDWPP